MTLFLRIVSRLSLFSAWASAALLIYATGHMLFEIFLRYFFNQSTHIVGEFVGYAVGGMTFLALAYSEEQKGLIRVNILSASLCPALRKVLDTACLAMVFGMMGFLTYYVGRIVIRDYERGRLSIGLSEIPTWIPQSILLFGLVMFLIQLLASMLRIVSDTSSPSRDAPEH